MSALLNQLTASTTILNLAGPKSERLLTLAEKIFNERFEWRIVEVRRTWGSDVFDAVEMFLCVCCGLDEDDCECDLTLFVAKGIR